MITSIREGKFRNIEYVLYNKDGVPTLCTCLVDSPGLVGCNRCCWFLKAVDSSACLFPEAGNIVCGVCGIAEAADYEAAV